MPRDTVSIPHPPRHPHKIRFTDTEWASIVARATACATPPARYCRVVALGSVPRARHSTADAELIRHLARIGNNINQLARAANDLGRLAPEAELRRVLDELLDTIRHIRVP